MWLFWVSQTEENKVWNNQFSRHSSVTYCHTTKVDIKIISQEKKKSLSWSLMLKIKPKKIKNNICVCMCGWPAMLFSCARPVCPVWHHCMTHTSLLYSRISLALVVGTNKNADCFHIHSPSIKWLASVNNTSSMQQLVAIINTPTLSVSLSSSS